MASRLIGGALALALAVTSTALTRPAGAQVLQIAIDQFPGALDPHTATAGSSQLVDSTIYEGLTAIDADLHVVPALAQSWSVSADGLTYVFRLRTDARFHDGGPVRPADVVASVARVCDPNIGSPLAARFAMIAKVEPDGAAGVRFTLIASSAPFLSRLATLAIVPEAARQGRLDLAKQPDGTGPFRFKEWASNRIIALDRNEAYWQVGLPKLLSLRFNIVPEAATRQIGLTGGTYQVLPGIGPATAEQLQEAPGVRVLATPDLAYSLIGLNAAMPPFDQPEVREALDYAIDRGQIVRAAYSGKAAPAGPLSPALKDWALPTSDFPCYRHDPERAKALLRDAGLRLPVKVTLNVLSGIQQMMDLAGVVQAQAREAGFEITLNVQDEGRFVQDRRAGDFQAFAAINGGGPDPDDYFGPTFQTGGAANVYKFSNPKLDQLLIDARAVSDPAKRKPLYDEAQRILACHGPVIHLAYGTLFSAERSDVRGFRITPTRSLRGLRGASVAP